MSTSYSSISTELVVADISIRKDDDGRYCLNDLHKAAGCESRHQPAKWLANQQTQEFIIELERTGTGIPVILAKQGLGTFVCKDLVYGYAMWISPAFKVKVIRAYDAMVTGNDIPRTFGEALQLAAEQQLLIEAQAEKIEQDNPKVAFHDDVARSMGEFEIAEAAKSFLGGVGSTKLLREKLIESGWLTRRSNGYEATAKAISLDLMRTHVKTSGGRTVTYAVLTPSGLIRARHLVRSGEMLSSEAVKRLSTQVILPGVGEVQQY